MTAAILEVSISMAAVIIIALAIVPLVEKKYSAKGRYILWLILTIRLLIPFNFSLPSAPVTLQPREYTVALRTGAPIPVQIMPEGERIAAGNASPSSADYAPLISLKDLFIFIWLAGAAVFLLFHLSTYWSFRFKLRKTLKYEGQYNGLRYYRCPAAGSPLMTGFFRPVILLPNEEYSAEELDLILKHEYTHFRRGDLWYKLVLLAANALHWFNPAVYFMVRRANKDLEYSCDEAVTRDMSFEQRRLYSMTLLKTMKRTMPGEE